MYRSNILSSSSTRFFSSRTWNVVNQGETKLLKRQSITRLNTRQNSKSSSSSKNSSYIGASVATVGLLGVGTTVYVKYDDNVRNALEDTLPFTKPLFTSLYGDIPKKESLLPVEKDLSIPFQVTVIDEETMEDTPVAPQFVDNLGSDPQEEKVGDVLALNTLDTPGISVMDLELSSRNKSEATHPPEYILPSEEKVLCDEDSHQHVYDEIKEEIVTEIVTETSENTATENFVMVNLDDIATLDDNKQQSDIIEPIQDENSPIEDILPIDDGPLTEEEIQALSELVDTSALEVVLDASAENLKHISNLTVNAQKQAAESIRSYLSQFSSTLFLPKDDTTYESAWQAVSDLEKASQEVIDKAAQRASELKAEVAGLKELVGSVRKAGANEVADKTDSVLASCNNEVNLADSDVDKAKDELKFFIDFQNFVQNAPSQLQEELKKFTPDLLNLLKSKTDEWKDLATEKALLMLALKRSEQLMAGADLEKIETSKEFEKMLEKEKEDIQKSAAEKIEMAVKKIEQEKSMEQELKIQELEVAYEREILSQLKRQASAHNAHLHEALEEQAETLESKHQQDTTHKLSEQQREYEFNLEKNLACIHGIQSKITEVTSVEQRQRMAQELWIASQALEATLDEALFHGRTRTLMPEILSIIHLSGQNEVLQELLESVPEAAAMYGVIPEKDLIKRFEHVKSVCKKVALVDEHGGSIGTYMMSYIKSLFVYSGFYKSSVNEPIDVDNLGPYEILTKAEYFIHQGDLEQAAKFMTQLKGAARKMSSDWLNEVRLLLETKQTSKFLLAYAASLNAGIN